MTIIVMVVCYAPQNRSIMRPHKMTWEQRGICGDLGIKKNPNNNNNNNKTEKKHFASHTLSEQNHVLVRWSNK